MIRILTLRVLFCPLILTAKVLSAQEVFPPPENAPVMSATRVPTNAIALDGRLDETHWRTAQPITGFTQREPVQGTAASVDTEVGQTHQK
ncbi:MAG: hypothetical protein AAF927_20140 [Bacteroidota bacterium]